MTTRGHVAFSAMAIVAGAGPAFAVDEIVVTAQRREEKLQDVPLAVSAFNADSIENRQIDVVKDIGQNVPNLQTYTVTAGAQAIQIHSRGASIQNPGIQSFGVPGRHVHGRRLFRPPGQRQPRSDRHRAHRGAARPAGHALRPQHHRRRHQGHQPHAGQRPLARRLARAMATTTPSRSTGSLGGPIARTSLAGSVAVVYDKRNQGWQDNTHDRRRARASTTTRRGAPSCTWYGTEQLRCRADGLGRGPRERRLQRRALRAVRQPSRARREFPAGAGWRRQAARRLLQQLLARPA